jgi:hypothetical protein
MVIGLRKLGNAVERSHDQAGHVEIDDEEDVCPLLVFSRISHITPHFDMQEYGNDEEDCKHCQADGKSNKYNVRTCGTVVSNLFNIMGKWREY